MLVHKLENLEIPYEITMLEEYKRFQDEIQIQYSANFRIFYDKITKNKKQLRKLKKTSIYQMQRKGYSYEISIHLRGKDEPSRKTELKNQTEKIFEDIAAKLIHDKMIN